jgi:ubiquinone/menaquinone biosynthesis C-methylase UbiE
MADEPAPDRLNRVRYSLYAPIYDIVAAPLERGRRLAIETLDLESDDRILIVGCGTGGDLPYLPAGATVDAIDVTPGMVSRTQQRGAALDLDLDARVADARSLPFDEDQYDAVLLHLILAVAPEPDRIMQEVERVLAPGGRVSVYDKYVPPGTTPSLLRRMVNPLATLVATSLTRELAPMLAETAFSVAERGAVLGGIYRIARLESDQHTAL